MDTQHRGYSHLPPVTPHNQLTHLTVDTEVTATCLQSHITNNRHTWLWTQRLQPPASSHTSQTTDTPDCGHRGYSHLPPVTPHNQLTHLTVDTKVTATCLQSHITNNRHTWLWTQRLQPPASSHTSQTTDTPDCGHRGYSHLPPVTHHKQPTHLTVDTEVTATCLQSHLTNNRHTWLWTQRLQPPASSHTSQTTDTPDCGHRGYSHLPPVTPHNQLTHLTVDTAYYSHLPPVTLHKQLTHLTVDTEVTATCLQSHITNNRHTWLWTQRLQPPASSHTSQSTDTPDCGHSLLQPPASSHTSQTTDTPDCGRRGYSHLPPVTPHNQLTHLTVDTEVTATCLQSHLTINWHTWLWTQLITATCLQSHFTNNWHTWLDITKV